MPAHTYVWLDALTQKVREGGRIVNVAVVIATGVNANGNREILGMDVITTEDGAGWLAFLRSLVARGLAGVQLVISDAHEGLKTAIASVLTGASWQRGRTHAMRNLLTRVPKSSQSMVATLVRTIFEQPDAKQVWAQHARVVEQLADRFPDAAAMLIDMAPDLLAFTAFPVEHWSAIRSNNPKRGSTKNCADAPTWSASSPTGPPSIRLVGAVLAEQHDEWAVARRYMSAETLTKARMRVIDGDPEEVIQHQLTQAV